MGFRTRVQLPPGPLKKYRFFGTFFIVLYFVLHRCEKGSAQGLLKLCKGDGLGSLFNFVFSFQ